jgi:hypothetical protein
MASFKQNVRTKLTGLIILLAVVYGQFSQQQWHNKSVIMADAYGYYAYLPALFIHDDLGLEHPEEFASEVWFTEEEDGTRYIKFTCGMAIAYSPFFFIAHTFAEPLGAPADGYSYPYHFALAMGAIVYLIIALIFLSKFLLLYFKDSVVAITILLLFAATNAFQYYTVNMTLSHGYSLALISVFLYCAARWLSEPKFKWAIWIGLSAGLFVLIRPIDVLFLFALPLLGIASVDGLKERFRMFWKQKKHILLMLVGFFVMLLPQLLYFKFVSGSFFFFSYTGESFYFGSPHLFDSLFSYRNGWLIYSPIMILSIVGLFFLQKQKTKFALFIIPVTLLYFYIIASWWCWWYTGFGNRAFINLYPLLSIPLASFVHFVLTKKAYVKNLFKVVVLSAVTLSVFQTYQYAAGIIHWGAMTEEAYWDSFLREQPSQLFQTYLHFPVTEKQIDGRDVVLVPKANAVYAKDFSFEMLNACDSTMVPYVQFNEARTGKGALYVEDGVEFLVEFPLNIKDVDAVYITAWVKDPPRGLSLTLSEAGMAPFTMISELAGEYDGSWSKLQLFYWVPEDFEPDSLVFRVWNPWKESCFIDDLELKVLNYTYEEKER